MSLAATYADATLSEAQVTDTSASMIMNPKVAGELREDYRSAAMRAGSGGLLGGPDLRKSVAAVRSRSREPW